jgi:hypothetical protein
MHTNANPKPKHRPKAAPTTLPQPDHRAILARRLDLIADCELQHGHTVRAEYLARQAAELRGVA